MMIRKEIISHALGAVVKKEIHARYIKRFRIRKWRQFMENLKRPYSEVKHMLVIIGRNNDFQIVFLMRF